MGKNLLWFFGYFVEVLKNKSQKSGWPAAVCLSLGGASIEAMALSFLLPSSFVVFSNALTIYLISGFFYQNA